MQQDPIDSIKKLAEPLVQQEELFLVDVEIRHAKVPEIWILVDSETGGVSVGACSRISREVDFLMDSRNLFDGAYRLNVSSPGLGRPLSDKRQYAKNRGRTARVKYQSEAGYCTLEGTLKDVHENELVLLVDDEKPKTISFEEIVETKIIPKI